MTLGLSRKGGLQPGRGGQLQLMAGWPKEGQTFPTGEHELWGMWEENMGAFKTIKITAFKQISWSTTTKSDMIIFGG